MHLLLAWILTGSFYLAAAILPAEIDAFLRKDKISSSQVSLLIAQTRSGKVLAAYRKDQSRKPASVIKLLTAYAALRELSADFRWPTRFYIRGTLRHGTLHGDLIVKAYGDPTLSSKDLERIVRRFKRMGIRKITGDILLDRSFFRVGEKISSGFDNHPYSEYNAMPDTIMFNDHLCEVEIANISGRPVARKRIPDESYRIVNQLKSTKQSCRGRYSWPRVKIRKVDGMPTLYLSGTLSSHCRTRVIKEVLSHPYDAFFYAFRAELLKQGVRFEGSLRLAPLPKDAHPLLTHDSRPLSEILAKTLKKSNNLYARHLFLLLGAKRYGPPATIEKGRKALKAILEERGILDGHIVLDNGCGLSRSSRLDASTLYRLLQDAYKSYGWEWMKMLAIAGVDGTIRRRFRHSPVRKHAWMKTGTLKNAKNIAGYVKGRSGKLYTVVILYNGPERWKGSLLANQILEWIVKSK